MTRLIAMIAAILWVLTPAYANAAWVEAKSESFVFVGDVSPKRAEKILTELENYRAILFRLYGAEAESEPERAKLLNVYVEGVPQASNPQAYFGEVFGKTPDAFGEDLRAYYKRNRYPGKTVTFASGMDAVAVTTRSLNKAERDFHRGEAVRQFRAHQDEGRAIAADYYDKTARASDLLPALAAQIDASRALIAMRDDDAAAAQTHMDSALANDPENARILHVTAKVAFGRYTSPSVPSTTEDMTRTRRQFKTAMRAAPKNMQAHFDYVATYAETGDMPSKQALYSARECTHHYRSADLFGTNMMLASVLMRGDDMEAARFHIQRAALWGPNASARAQARKMLALTE